MPAHYTRGSVHALSALTFSIDLTAWSSWDFIIVDKANSTSIMMRSSLILLLLLACGLCTGLSAPIQGMYFLFTAKCLVYLSYLHPMLIAF